MVASLKVKIDGKWAGGQQFKLHHRTSFY